ncbi:hypothetical protein [Mastigocoleus testarum]|uniref:Uncharacterized protein n=1 Tax=Mastigocoleus testarum BC008 TaxID=371196 RepID=A0A0V7ZYP8_9CYAN|nr:hypothetical protein [Mastigocoleus testarum]KST69439.1 hypothetical protein BC008_35550 [Mastigocoleus testarum BC008]
MNFLVHAREGNSYTTTQGKVVTISETFTKISAPQTQREALNYIGIQFIGDRLILNFLETGNPYADAQGDRTKLGEKISDTVFVELALKQNPPQALEIRAYLLPFIEDGVNFAGNVNFKTPWGEKRKIPMTGRGTAALEGRANDAHAGFCTGGACASFQERSALVLAVAAAAGASDEQIDIIGEKLRQLNDKFHGRGDILSYCIECAKTAQNKIPSYKEFMTVLYPKGRRPPLLESIINTGKPNDAYFAKALTKMTDEELAADKEVLQIRL